MNRATQSTSLHAYAYIYHITYNVHTYTIPTMYIYMPMLIASAVAHTKYPTRIQAQVGHHSPCGPFLRNQIYTRRSPAKNPPPAKNPIDRIEPTQTKNKQFTPYRPGSAAHRTADQRSARDPPPSAPDRQIDPIRWPSCVCCLLCSLIVRVYVCRWMNAERRKHNLIQLLILCSGRCTVLCSFHQRRSFLEMSRAKLMLIIDPRVMISAHSSTHQHTAPHKRLLAAGATDDTTNTQACAASRKYARVQNTDTPAPPTHNTRTPFK